MDGKGRTLGKYRWQKGKGSQEKDQRQGKSGFRHAKILCIGTVKVTPLKQKSGHIIM
jgi:hypothetical protein